MNSQSLTGKISLIVIWMWSDIWNVSYIHYCDDHSSSNLDANTKFNIFYNQISQFINSHVPRRKLSKREIKLSTKPWFIKEILVKMQYRDKVYSQVNLKCNQPDPNLTLLYKKLRNSIVKDIKLCKSNYLKKYFLCNNNMRKIWSGIRSIINVSKLERIIFPLFWKMAS